MNLAALAAATQQVEKRESKLAAASVAKKVLFILRPEDQKGAGEIKRWAAEHKVQGDIAYVAMTPQKIQAIAKAKQYDFVAVSCTKTWKGLGNYWKEGNQDDWAGSVLLHPAVPACPMLLLPTLVGKDGGAKRYVLPTFSWELERYLGKILEYRGQYAYRYTICKTEQDYALALEQAKQAYIVCADIETNLNNWITSISFTYVSERSEILHTFVVDWTVQARFEVSVALSRTILGLPNIKCFHNGCFDTMYLMRFRAPARNWLLDTEYMWRCWEAEPDKSLARLASFCLPDFCYWKAEVHDNILEYNAKDSINTARCLLWLMHNMPAWAWRNYAQMLPTLIPTVVCNLEGFAVDQEKIAAAREKAEAEVARTLAELLEILALPNFNPGSPVQLSKVLYLGLGRAFGFGKELLGKDKRKLEAGKVVTATSEMNLKKLTHPLAARVVQLLLTWREQSKALSTYYNANLYGESKRLYYALQPDGTTTGRFACGSSSLRLVTGCNEKGQIRKKDIENYGSQIQNAPPYYKAALKADPGYEIVNIDKSRAEARCVGLISGDAAFRQAVNDDDNDFYLLLALIFFGIDTKDKKHPIRQVTKKINHASSYCMSIATFIDQVGVTKIYEFMVLVNWQGERNPRVFVGYLLSELFHGKFVGIKKWWKRITLELIRNNGLLTSPDGSVRHFFRYPTSPNSIYPPAVAHQPQRLSVMTLNRAMWQVFYEVQLPTNFEVRMKGQVHDSLVMQIRQERRDELAQQVLEIMERPYETKLGPLVIPCDVEFPGTHWKAEK